MSVCEVLPQSKVCSQKRVAGQATKLMQFLSKFNHVSMAGVLLASVQVSEY